jgi:hypothetical protein
MMEGELEMEVSICYFDFEWGSCVVQVGGWIRLVCVVCEYFLGCWLFEMSGTVSMRQPG